MGVGAGVEAVRVCVGGALPAQSQGHGGSRSVTVPGAGQEGDACPEPVGKDHR